MLRNRIIDIENKYSTYIPAPNEKTDGYIDADKAITCLSARVINNSTQKLKNYITLNKGRRDGIKAGMGVIVAQGTVGIVKGVSDKFSVVIPILNPEINISAKFKNSGYIGLLEWDGLNPGYAQLKGIARHINVNRGDSLITSGLTTNFPVGLQVGVVDEFELDENDSYYTIRVKLAVNFKTLSHVTVLENRNAEEQKQLEQENYTN